MLNLSGWKTREMPVLQLILTSRFEVISCYVLSNLIAIFTYLFIFIFFVYYRDADDTKAWISEKDTALSTSDYGRDLASVQALQRKHEVLERDLAALEEKVW